MPYKYQLTHYYLIANFHKGIFDDYYWTFVDEENYRRTILGIPSIWD